jgi:hypothetical protein
MRFSVFVLILFVVLTTALLAYDLTGPPAAGGGFFHTGGEVWFALSPDTLNLSQAIVQRYLLPQLWDPVLVSLLRLPAAGLAGILTLLAAIIWWRRQI